MGFSQEDSLERVPEPLPSTLTVLREKLKGPHLMSHPKGICRAGFIIQSRKGLCHGQMALMCFECYINSNLMAHLFVGLKFYTINEALVFTNNLCTALCLFRIARRQRSWRSLSWPMWFSDPGISWDSLRIGGRDDKKVVCRGVRGHSRERRRGKIAGGCFIPDVFDKALPQLLQPLNSGGRELGTLSDRLSLASDLWSDLGRFIAPCCVSPPHFEKKKKKANNKFYSSFKVSFLKLLSFQEIFALYLNPTQKNISLSQTPIGIICPTIYGQEHRLWWQTELSVSPKSCPHLNLNKSGNIFELPLPTMEWA